MFLAIVLALALPADAKTPTKPAPVASGCPWAGAEKPNVESSTMTTLKINGVLYDVHLKENREKFVEILELCNADDAVEPYETWRARRRATNIAAVTGPVTFIAGAFIWPIELGVAVMAIGAAQLPVAAGLAGPAKEKAIDAIEDSTPPEN